MKLIQGFFIQREIGLDLDTVGGPLGLVAGVRPHLMPFMYAGVCWMQEGTDVWQGEMLDQLGYERLSDIVFEEGQFGFTKQYVRGNGVLVPKDGICYRFDAREGNTWVGTYTHLKISPAPTRCIVTEVDDTLFQGDIQKFLLSESARFPGVPAVFSGGEGLRQGSNK